MPTIELWNYSGVGLIILYPSGVTYSNQTAGIMCAHPTAEGVYMPLSNDQRLANQFMTVGQPFDKDDIAYLIDYLASSDDTSFLTIDDTRLGESHEAWLYVNIGKPRWPVLIGFEGYKGILTWENSD